MDELRYLAEVAMNGPKLIDVGRGVIDAREICGVLTIAPEDFLWQAEHGKAPFPAYARTQIMYPGGYTLTSLDEATIVRRWCQALGLPEPIGAEER